MQRYVLTVLPADLLATLRYVALDEITTQIAMGNNPSQIIVDNISVGKRGIDRAMRSVKARFQDTASMLKAIAEVYELLQQVTRIQNPPKNSLVARKNFHLWLNGVSLGLMPAALARIAPTGVLTQDSVVRIVGPLVPYGRKLFWNPVGASSKMSFYRTASKRSGVRFLPTRGSSALSPRFKPWSSRTLRRKANRASAPAVALASMMRGDTPPGRIENTGEIVTRIVARNPSYRGLHIADGWVEFSPAMGWSKIRDPRVPSISIQFAKKGALLISGGI